MQAACHCDYKLNSLLPVCLQRYELMIEIRAVNTATSEQVTGDGSWPQQTLPGKACLLGGCHSGQTAGPVATA
jgi:hypothetical protein